MQKAFIQYILGKLDSYEFMQMRYSYSCFSFLIILL